MIQDFSSVTEIAGHMVSKMQIDRIAQRYYWAGEYCKDRDVLEVACGVGQGLGYLASLSQSVQAGDITPSLVKQAREYYGDRIRIIELDAADLPYESNSLDVVILFEAIYYLPSVEKFIEECRRVLRAEGILLLATANCDLFDFNPSPYSIRYYNPPELTEMLAKYNFESKFYGGWAVESENMKGKIIRVIKKIAVIFNLIPKSMKGKRWLKRLVFGKLVTMPNEIKATEMNYKQPVPIDGTRPDIIHQVLYCEATIKK